jgi:DNA adenine methylase
VRTGDAQPSIRRRGSSDAHVTLPATKALPSARAEDSKGLARGYHSSSSASRTPTTPLGESVSVLSEANRDSNVPPFLKWAGGKRWLTSVVSPLAAIGANATYFEPFLGSAAMYFHWQPAKAVLSDTNAALVETYAALRRDHARVTTHLRRHASRHDDDYYYAVRDKAFRTEFTRAAQFIYLNRTCWNGLYRVNRQGSFNVPRGSKANVLLDTDDFESVSRILQGATILCSDFEAQIDTAMSGDVVFADPPYTVRHQHNGFVKYNEKLFSWDDQVRLRDALLRAKTRGVLVLLTNADHESVRALYNPSFQVQEIARFSAISSSASTRGDYAELLIT